MENNHNQWLNFEKELDRMEEIHLMNTHFKDDRHATELMRKLRRLNDLHNPSMDTFAIARAFYYVRMIYKDQTHYSGAPLFTHVLEVADMVADCRPNTEAILTALFHELEVASDFSLAMVEDEFGLVTAEKVACFTAPVAHIDPAFRVLDYRPREDTDVRTVMLFNQLYDMRTVDYLELEVQQQQAAETIQDFFALAAQLGLTAVEQELNELCYQVLCPHKSLSLLPHHASEAMAVLSRAFQPPVSSAPGKLWNVKPELNH